jgi:hypothetical protein
MVGAHRVDRSGLGGHRRLMYPFGLEKANSANPDRIRAVVVFD